MNEITSVFQVTIGKSGEWVKDVMELLGIRDPRRGVRALRAGLHAIRDRLPPEEAVDLGAQMPMLLRGLYFEGWRLLDRPVKMRTVAEMADYVDRAIEHDPALDPEAVLRAVVRVLAWRISGGELDDVFGALPMPVRRLWEESMA